MKKLIYDYFVEARSESKQVEVKVMNETGEIETGNYIPYYYGSYNGSCAHEDIRYQFLSSNDVFVVKPSTIISIKKLRASYDVSTPVNIDLKGLQENSSLDTN